MKNEKFIKTINAPTITTQGGVLSFIQNEFLDFDIKRVYYIINNKNNQVRGKHAHKTNKQVIFCLHGSFELYLEDKDNVLLAKMTPNGKGFYIQPNVWHEMRKMSKGCIILVLASHEYDEQDYIRNYSDYTINES